jgi:uracil-DNA glycosylase
MENLLDKIYKCQLCKESLPNPPNPILTASSKSEIAIIGQAPGRIVEETGIPWNDKSGERLRSWLDLPNNIFYDPEKIALIPIGFCYPGKGKSGDLPPRKECAPEWQKKLFEKMPNLKLTILIGAYAQAFYLKGNQKKTLTETVKAYKEYLPKYIVLPHPSPRNNIWLKKNEWFEELLVPEYQQRVIKSLMEKTV